MGELAIIGGGAAGLAAAITAARGGCDVEVYEADERVGRSILATGNGRCNFSNAHPSPELYRNAAFVGEALRALSAARPSGDPVHGFFADLGLVWRKEADGRMYPQANKASSVLDALRFSALDAGVRLSCKARAVRVDAPRRSGERLHVRFSDGAVAHAQVVVVATGGRGVEALELPAGIGRVAVEPTLGPLATDTSVVRRLNNIRVRCAVSLEGPDGAHKAREVGELLFRDYGVSGIAVFNLSRLAQPGDVLCVDLLAAVEDAEAFLLERRARMAAGRGRELTVGGFLTGLLVPQVAEVVASQAGLRLEDGLGQVQVASLARACKRLRLEVRGVGDARQCQVARGGLAVEGFDARTMQARAVPGLFAVGEALDVDGPCGGHNLHWAWASGMLAGACACGLLGNA